MKTYSQFGEDLILFNFFDKIKLSKGFFIEFGAYDGVFLSNCRLFYEHGWEGCFVEVNKKRFLQLEKNYHNEPKIKLLNESINTTDNTLDCIVQKNQIKEIDLLSIDIDGKDLSVWKTSNNLKAKFVIIEYNKFIPFDVEFEDTTDHFIGNSILSIYKYAISKDYELIKATHTNLIFVDKFFNDKRIKSINIADVYDLLKPLRIGYSWKGEMLFFENGNMDIKEYFKHPMNKPFMTFQPIPKFLRKLSNVDGSGAKILKVIYSRLVLIILRPNLYFLRIKNRIESLIKNKNLEK